MRLVLFAFLYCLSLYFIGRFVINRIQLTNNKLAFFAVGFVFHISVVELLGWWMVAFREPFYLFFGLVILITLIGFFAGVKTKVTYVEDFEKKLNFNFFLTKAILFVLFVILSVFIFYLYRSDADDSFYVSNVLLFSKSDRLNMYDSSFGNHTFGTVPMYDFQIWESYLAVFCKIFSIKASVMCHYIMPFVLLFLAVSAYILLGDVFFKSKEKSYLFTVILLGFYCMGGYAVYSKGSFLLSRLWQGKAVYLHIVLPFALAYMLSLVEKKDFKKGQSICLMLIMLAGIALNPTSMYVVGFQIIFMMTAIAIYKKDWKTFMSIVPTLLIVVIFSLMILIRTSKFDGQIEAASAIQEHFALNVFKNFLGSGTFYLVVYLFCCIIIMMLGDIKGKILCIVTPVLLFIGIWNPIMAPLVARKLTMVPSYWRVFWLLPIDFAIAYCGVLICKKEKKYIVAFLLLLFMTIFSGKFMFTTQNNFIKAENKERIPSDVLYFGEKITTKNENNVVLANDRASTTLRQEYNEIELIYSRYQYILDLIMYRGRQQEAKERIHLMNFVNGYIEMDELTFAYIGELLEQYNVEWIIIGEDQQPSIGFLEESNYLRLETMNGQVLMQNAGSGNK